MTWKNTTAQPERKPYKAIKCLTCDKIVPSRAYLSRHKNHDVRYVNPDGSIDP